MSEGRAVRSDVSDGSDGSDELFLFMKRLRSEEKFVDETLFADVLVPFC
jgi:hypothetical protein